MKKRASLLILVVAILMASALPALAQGPMYTVSGRVFLDANRNGAWDAGEGPVEADAPPMITAGRYRAQVAEDGTYQLHLPAGTHSIRVSVVSRSRLVATTAPFVVLSVASDRGDVNFGFAVWEPEAKKPVLPVLPKMRLPAQKRITPREPGLARP